MFELRPILEYPGYLISPNGRLWSVRTQRFLTPRRTKGYLTYHLRKDLKGYSPYIHQLVAMAYIANPLGLTEVNHKDEDKHNNLRDNLEWCNRQYNVEYSQAGIFNFITSTGEHLQIFNLSRFCRDNGLSQPCMSLVHAGKIKQYKGWHIAT